MRELAGKLLVIVNGRIVFETTRDRVESELETIKSYLAMGAS